MQQLLASLVPAEHHNTIAHLMVAAAGLADGASVEVSSTLPTASVLSGAPPVLTPTAADTVPPVVANVNPVDVQILSDGEDAAPCSGSAVFQKVTKTDAEI